MSRARALAPRQHALVSMANPSRYLRASQVNNRLLAIEVYQDHLSEVRVCRAKKTREPWGKTCLLSGGGSAVSFQITILKVLAGQPEGNLSVADLRNNVAILISSGRDWTDRTKRIAARTPGLSTFSARAWSSARQMDGRSLMQVERFSLRVRCRSHPILKKECRKRTRPKLRPLLCRRSRCRWSGLTPAVGSGAVSSPPWEKGRAVFGNLTFHRRAAGRGRRRPPKKRRRPLIGVVRMAGSHRPIQHDCADDRIPSAIGNAIRSLT
jgi:hypothetical protein